MFPAPSKALNLPAPVVGGWMYGLAGQVAAQTDVHLAVATTCTASELKSYDIENIRYYLLPSKSKTIYQKSLELLWQQVCGDFKPDVVHIHGTEYLHGLACMRSCSFLKYVVSIQGIVGIYARYYLGGMSLLKIMKNVTFRDIIRRDTLFQGKRRFRLRGQLEKEYMVRSSHVIGRTSWDYTHAKIMNPEIRYHFCNESLRDVFYEVEKWDVKNKTDFTIFCSQAGYPIKGLHQVLKAVALLKEDFPNIRIRVAGYDITSNRTLIEKLRLTGYGKYIRGLINARGLEDKVYFTGPLNETQMANEYKNAHVFVCPSSIENSANSVGEAQILGTPTIASYVGGLPDMVTHSQTGLLYRFEEVEMLAENIRRVFTDDQLAMYLSSNAIAAAQLRHDRKANLERTLEIYREVKTN